MYEEKPMSLLDVKERVTQSHVVTLYMVSWSNHDERDATWETKVYLKETYLAFYEQWLVNTNLEMRFL